MDKLYILGIDAKELNEGIKEVISLCDIVIGSNEQRDRILKEGWEIKDFFPISPLNDALDYIKRNRLKKGIVVLASGDPLFFGVGRRLLNEIGKRNIEIIPAISSMQFAFSRIKEPWDDVFFISVHGRDIKELVTDIHNHERVCIFTDSKNTPARIAKMLIEAGFDCRAFVCENIGMEEENITEADLDVISKEVFSDLNLMILLNLRSVSIPSYIFGLSESDLIHTRGLITKDEVRAVTLHKLRIPEKGVVWDIGSGSGSIAIETARVSPKAMVYAIEKEGEAVCHIFENKRRFFTHNLEIVYGEAPDALSNLPNPDRVFIGGSAGRLEGIMTRVSESLNAGGRIVINATTIETLTMGKKLLDTEGFSVEITEVSIARTKRLKGMNHLSALNPVFILMGRKDEG
ncbi:MAG: precorrin-6y C5,15-methyltransferase (decarboxylating) subunit CbiE [Thermodesulfobacteriota bacterium]|nr:precorrin-6y C5,15-methyltransferase (decarboxylating) subunit CbiE [Thermodesulfobacteriota bacterium]